MQFAPGIPMFNINPQLSARSRIPLRQKSDDAENGTSYARCQSQLDAQRDRIETSHSNSVLLCPHIIFRCFNPIDLKIRLTPTITVIPPIGPPERDCMFATTIGEHVNLTLSIEGNGKITRIDSEPEGTKSPEKLKLLKRSQSKGAGGKWYVSRMETQLEGGWGSAEVGEIGGHGKDGKKRNPGIMLDLSFKGEQNEKRSFAVTYEKLSEFLDLFMDTCGFPKRDRRVKASSPKIMINFWARRLPQESPENEFLLIKLLPVEDLITILPIRTIPPPGRTIRFFIIIRRATREIVSKEGLQVRGEMARVVYEVLGNKPPPIISAPKEHRRRAKAKAKGHHRGSNISIRAAKQLTSPNPDPWEPVNGETGLTIFEYGGVLTASQVSDGQMAEEAGAAGCSENAPEEEKGKSIPSEALRKSLNNVAVEDCAKLEVTPSNISVDQPVVTEVIPQALPQAGHPTLLNTQYGLGTPGFAAYAPEEPISSLYYHTQPSLYDPFMYTHQYIELQDPNQPVFMTASGNESYGGEFPHSQHQH
ncbi:hypothetical protein ABW20_dc0106409 [Dactylellina cionopaga]|nr:hypothetical protein ABW20_dc0106409 [Dactylellina cionopaga]